MTNDSIVETLKRLGLPVDRDHYVSLNWCGDYDPKKPLPAELEASLPEELQLSPPELLS